MSRRHASALAVLLACTLVAAPASAYQAYGATWPGQFVVFNYNDGSFSGPVGLDFTSVRNHLTAATYTWVAPGCTILSVSLGSSTTTGYEHDSDPADLENVIYYETDLNGWENVLHNDSTVYGDTHYQTELVIALIDTDIIFNGTGITDGDLNGTDWILDGTAANRIDFESVALHEMGHAIGLDHNAEPGASIMFPALFNGEVNRTLRQDDVDAVCALYPNPFSMAGMDAECTTDHDCATGTCAFDGSTHTCQYACASDCDCPGTEACTPTATSGVSVCRAGTNTCPSTGTHTFAQNGAACVHAIDCLSNRCYTPPTGTAYCTRRCTSDCDCNSSFMCDTTVGMCVTATGATHCDAPDGGTGGMLDGGTGAPPPGHGGCTVTRSPGSSAWIAGLVLALVVSARRRTKRR